MAQEDHGRISELVKLGADETFDHLENAIDGAISVLRRVKNVGAAVAEGVLDGGSRTIDVWIEELEQVKITVAREARGGVNDIADAIPG